MNIALICAWVALGISFALPVPSSRHAGSSVTPAMPDALTAREVWRWRENTRHMLQHAYGNYMRHAYPADELKPLSCEGRRWDKRERGTLDDCLGGYALTLVDSLSTLALTGDLPAFRRGVARVIAEVWRPRVLSVCPVAMTHTWPSPHTLQVRVDRNVFVSVFEANIRVLGGLLSAHQLAADTGLRIFDTGLHCPAAAAASNDGDAEACAAVMCSPAEAYSIEGGTGPLPCLLRYDGQLLALAVELATRLLPAFDTPTGLPVHRVNLATGAQDPSSRQTCAAAAGTYLLEFGLLSRLTGDPMFEAVARRATAALWSRRSAIQLVPSGCVDGSSRRGVQKSVCLTHALPLFCMQH